MMAEEIKYQKNLCLWNTSTHNIFLRKVGRGKVVLDVGCAWGTLGKLLLEKKAAKMFGIEKNKEMAEEAKKNYEKIIIADVELVSDLPFPKGYFDIIIFGDVLEHLRSPGNVFKKFKRYLSDNGFILVSLPNIANWNPRFNLFIGNFEYTPTGILDTSHLRFYTKKTGKQLIEHAGYKVKEILPAGKLVRFIKFFSNLLAYQFVFIAEKAEEKKE